MDTVLRRSDRSALSPSDVLAVVAIAVVLIAVLIPGIRRADSLANRALCAGNLRRIVQSEVAYAQSNDTTFATTPGLNGKTYCNQPRFPTGWNPHQSAKTVVADWYGRRPHANRSRLTAADRGNPLACMYLLVLQGYTTTKSFICPSDPQATAPSEAYTRPKSGARKPMFYGNFGVVAGGKSPNKFGEGESYSIAYPWQSAVPQTLQPIGPEMPNLPGMPKMPKRKIVISNGSEKTFCASWWTDNIGANVPVISDMAPLDVKNLTEKFNRITTTPVAKATQVSIFNTGNHRGKGENVAYGDLHVNWCVNPYVGANHDNIFTYHVTRDGHTVQVGLSHVGRQCPAPILTATMPRYDTCMVPVRNVKSGAW
jgi:type II secretory pathway pseudopilin PulG